MDNYAKIILCQQVTLIHLFLVMFAIVVTTTLSISFAYGDYLSSGKDLVYRTVGARKLFLDIYFSQTPTATLHLQLPYFTSISLGFQHGVPYEGMSEICCHKLVVNSIFASERQKSDYRIKR
jgi:hypothetical protein